LGQAVAAPSPRPARAAIGSDTLAWLSPGTAPLLAALAAAALFGAAMPLCKPLLGELPPTLLAGLLYLGAAAAVAPLALRQGLAPAARRGPSLVRLAGVVIFGGALAPLLLLAGLARAPAGSVALWLNLEVAATVLLARLFFHEPLAARGGLALALVCAASLLLALPAHAAGAAWPALALVAAACLCWALDNNWTSRIDAFTPAQATFAKGLVAGSVNLALGSLLADDARVAPARAGLALAIGAASYGLSLVLVVSAAQRLGAARTQLAFASASLWGVVFAWLLLGEPVLASQLTAAAAMALAFALLHGEAHGHWHLHERATHRHWHRHDDGHHEHPHPGPTARRGHSHEHTHAAVGHSHPHHPDLHHRHPHTARERR
jgi:drug/metabolite transporter (DMT)-like permease